METNDLREHEKFGDFAGQTKVSWSKNVMEECACPDQLLLGANDPDFCILLALACYLENKMEQVLYEPGSDGMRYLFGDFGDDDEPIRPNERYRDTLEKLWKDPEFKELLAQVRGTVCSHSVRKFAST